MMEDRKERPVPERLQAIAESARELGWEVSYNHHRGLAFEKEIEGGTAHIWGVCGGWQRADMIDDRYQNHRGIKNLSNHLVA